MHELFLRMKAVNMHGYFYRQTIANAGTAGDSEWLHYKTAMGAKYFGIEVKLKS